MRLIARTSIVFYSSADICLVAFINTKTHLGPKLIYGITWRNIHTKRKEKHKFAGL